MMSGGQPGHNRKGINMAFRLGRLIWAAGICFALWVSPAAARDRSRVTVHGQDYDYLARLAQHITESARPPGTLKEFEALRPRLREECLDVLGLKPLPEKTPLQVEWIGEPVDLGPCLLRRVTFYSATQVLTACYLFLPHETDEPVPVIIYVCGSAGQTAYLHHCIMYALSGFAALALPQRPQNGPIFGENHHWYSTGYHPCGVMVWDVVRAVDFLETMPALIDADRIGLTGRSSGSYKTWWAAAVEPRIACALPSQGANTAAGMCKPLRSNIKGDHTVLPNCYLRDYQQYWALRAPRPLLHQHGTHDGMNRDAPTVMDYITGVYRLYGRDENAHFQVFKQGHEDTAALRQAGFRFFDAELRDGAGHFADVTPQEAERLLAEADLSLPSIRGWDAEKRRSFSRIDYEAAFARPTPEWTVRDRKDFTEFKTHLTEVLRTKVLRRLYTGRRKAAFDPESGVLTLEGGALERRMVLYPRASGRAPVVLMLHLPGGEDFPGPAADRLRAAVADAGCALAVLEPTGGGGPRGVGEEYARQWKGREGHVVDDVWRYPNLHRLAAVAGHTLCSLRAQDVLAGTEALRGLETVDPDRVYLWGRGALAVPALYAAVVDQRLAGVLLVNAPDSHRQEQAARTGLLHIRVHADLPRAGGLIYPRPFAIIRAEPDGWEWTKQLYERLGRPSRFRLIRPGGAAARQALKSLTE